MQLSSVFLSVTAFLAQAASGFYLLQATHDKLSDLGYAKVQFYGTQATVWFNNHVDAPFAPIHLDVGGDLGSGFVFRAHPLNYGPYENGWEMLSRAATSVEEGDITGPFAVDEENRFVYRGAEGGVWNACGDKEPPQVQLFFSATPMDEEYCFGNITLVTTEII